MKGGFGKKGKEEKEEKKGRMDRITYEERGTRSAIEKLLTKEHLRHMEELN